MINYIFGDFLKNIFLLYIKNCNSWQKLINDLNKEVISKDDFWDGENTKGESSILTTQMWKTLMETYYTQL